MEDRMKPENIDEHAEKEGTKILPFRRNIRVNIGVVIFAFIFLYLCYSVVHYATRKTYAVYEIGKAESLVGSRDYQALILRDETIVSSEYDGFLDLYVQEGLRVKVGSVIASVDEAGVFSETVRDYRRQQSLSEENLLRLKEQLRELCLDYHPLDFGSIYSAKKAIDTYFLIFSGSAALDRLEVSSSSAEFFHRIAAESAGIILYYRDGFETKRAQDVTAADFSTDRYQRESSESLVNKGDFLYKELNSEKWSLIVPIGEEEAAYFASRDSIIVSFLQNGLRTQAGINVFTGSDGAFYMELSLNQYVMRFAMDRYVRIRLETEGDTGYKIPKKAVVRSDFFLIPKNYLTQGGAGESAGFYTETPGDAASAVSFRSYKIYGENEHYYYISPSEISEGTVLVKADSEERYTVRLSGSLSGVYQINAGYTVFCPVEILDESPDYCLIRRGTKQGVASFDRILLEPEGFGPNQLLE